MKLFIKIPLISILVLLSVIGLYVLLAYLAPFIKKNKNNRPPENGIDIHLKSDGVHADIILPVCNDIFDWTTILDENDFSKASSENYFAFGWGDKGFYLDIPEWSDLNFRIAFKAMCVPSPTLMHIIHYEELPVKFKYFHSTKVTPEQYEKICDYILDHFDLKDGKAQLLPGKGYTPRDHFYKANYSYHAFKTCNEWVNRAMKEADMPAAIWAPSAKGVFRACCD